MRLEGKVAIVTGGGGGIGRAIVEVLASEGAAVVVNDYGVTVDGREPKASVAEEIAQGVVAGGGRAIPHFGSVADFRTAKELIDLAVNSYGRLDTLVVAHGNLRERMIFKMSEEEWDAVVDVHLKGAFNCVRFATEQMREQRSGNISLLISTAGLEGNAAQANYSAAKLGMVGLAMATALAMGKYNVNVNCIAPSALTRMTARLSDKTAGSRGAGDRGDPRVIGVLAAALACDEARGMTGQVYEAVGSMLGRWSLPQQAVLAYREEPWEVETALQAVMSTLGTHPLRRFKALGLQEPVPPSAAAEGE